MTFTALPTSPFRETTGYRFQWAHTMGRASYTARDNAVVAMNDATGDAIHFDLPVSRDGYPDAVIRDLCADPCNREGNPTTCPVNDRVLRTDRERYAVGDAFEVTVPDAPPGVHWYVTSGLADVVQSDQGRSLRARVTSLPVHVHAQPDSVVGMAVCHGWTERWFYAP